MDPEPEVTSADETETAPSPANEEALDALEGSKDEGDGPCNEENIFDSILHNLKQLRKVVPQTAAVAESTRMLVCMSDYLKLRERYAAHPKCKKPSEKAGIIAARNSGQPSAHFARRIRSNALFFQAHGRLKPHRRGNLTTHACLLDNETIRQKCLAYLALQEVGEIKVRKFRNMIIEEILPRIEPLDNTANLPLNTISFKTARKWLRKLGYLRHTSKKGVYVDGHERPDVIESRKRFLQAMSDYQRRVK